MSTSTRIDDDTRRGVARRPASRPYAVAALALLVFVVFEAITYGWVAVTIVVIFLIVPDLSMIGRYPPRLARGQFPPAVVRRYNVAHSYWIPLALMLASVLPWPELWLRPGLEVFLAGLAWALHITVDRAIGFGPRGADGWQRLP